MSDIPKTMIAYRTAPHSQEIQREEIPVPELQPDEVLLKIQACSLCHTDITLLEHNSGISVIDEGHFTLGHEMAMVAVKNGSAANADLGQLYVCAALNPCLKCELCQAGRDNICVEPRLMFGIGKDGGYAEFIAVREDLLVKVPKGVSAETASAASCGGATAWHAIKSQGGLKKGQSLAVIGVGGVGLWAIGMARHLGASAFGIDLKQDSLAAAKEAGAQVGSVEEIRKLLPPLGVDVVLDTVGGVKTFEDGQTLLKPGGIIVVVGVKERSLPFSTMFNIKETRAANTFLSTKKELGEVMDLLAQGVLKPAYKTTSIADLPAAITEMRAGRNPPGRTVFLPGQ